MSSTLSFGAIGFVDDYLKITRRNHHGLLPRYKFGGADRGGRCWSASTLIVLANKGLYNTRLIFPFFKDLIPDLGLLLRRRSRCSCSSASSNAVNLTDGLDGLAISRFAVAAATFTALAYVTGHARARRLPAARALRARRRS